MNKEKIKALLKKKHGVTALCMILGMSMFTTAAYANYDDARGYENYKEAVKAIALYDDNYTVEGTVELECDGKTFGIYKGTLYRDGKDALVEGREGIGDKADLTSMELYLGNKEYTLHSADGTYDICGSDGFTTGIDINDKDTGKAVRFVELLGDTLVGDLKNNFVLTSKEDGERTYEVEVSGKQIPEVINAGISLLFAETTTSEDYGCVEFEDEAKLLAGAYKEKTGKDVDPDAYFEGEWDEDYDEIYNELTDKFYGILEDKGGKGVVYVKEDGSYIYYENYSQFQKEHLDEEGNGMDMVDMAALLGEDAFIKGGKCNFTVDKNGKLVSCENEATMAGYDANGKSHEVTLRINAKVRDYGTTRVPKVDLSKYTLSHDWTKEEE